MTLQQSARKSSEIESMTMAGIKHNQHQQTLAGQRLDETSIAGSGINGGHMDNSIHGGVTTIAVGQDNVNKNESLNANSDGNRLTKSLSPVSRKTGHQNQNYNSGKKSDAEGLNSDQQGMSVATSDDSGQR